jgi:hypothetical protein
MAAFSRSKAPWQFEQGMKLLITEFLNTEGLSPWHSWQDEVLPFP